MKSDSIDTIVEVIYGNMTPNEAIDLEMSLMSLGDTERVKAIVEHVHQTCEQLLKRMNSSYELNLKIAATIPNTTLAQTMSFPAPCM
jgi:hypothetical protein